MVKLQGHNPLKQSHVTLLKQNKKQPKKKYNWHNKKKLNTKYHDWKILELEN